VKEKIVKITLNSTEALLNIWLQKMFKLLRLKCRNFCRICSYVMWLLWGQRVVICISCRMEGVYNWFQGPVPDHSPAVEKHWLRATHNSNSTIYLVPSM